MGLALSLPFSVSRSRWLLALALALGGCSPEIGDECTTSTDCSQNADRICDISQPGGYCTIFNCEPAGSNPAAKCPDEAACVAFAVEASPIEGCANALGSTPYMRSYCLKKCENGDDCRSGYICIDVESAASGPNHYFSAANVDGSSKVCVVAFSAPPPTRIDDASSQVCSGSSETPDGAGGEGSGSAGAGGVSGG
jgi:hypothetical protein